MANEIVIKGAREHNLKDVDLIIPRDELVVINKTPTPADRSATLVLTGPIGELMAMDE